MSTTQATLAEQLVDAFEMFDDWEDKYRLLIDLGRKLPPLDEAEKTEENRIHGCQSKVWLVARPRAEGACRAIDFIADSDSEIVKGLIAILRRVYSGQPAENILAFDIEGLLERLDLSQHLSMNRRNGLYEMVKRIKTLALALNSGAARADLPSGVC